MSNPPSKTEKISRSLPFWQRPLEIHKSGYEHRGLAAFSINGAVGCAHGCSFCSSPTVAFTRQKSALASYGVNDPASEWGQFAFPHYWDENDFRASLRRAMQLPDEDLVPDGHRAVQYSTTVDPFMTFRDEAPEMRKLKQDILEEGFVKSLKMIRDESDFNVRILTRSPSAKKHFSLMKTFGDRLQFGMGIPTLCDDFARRFEPHAPSVVKRMETLQAAQEYGLHVFVAAAPLHPLLSDDDMEELVTMTNALEPVTVFAEPISRKGVNLEVMRKTFAESTPAMPFPEIVFSSCAQWADYAATTLLTFEEMAMEAGLADRLKLWPDSELLSKDAVAQLIEESTFSSEAALFAWVEKWQAHPTHWPGD